ncbi:hypothetical protein DMH18_20120 [Streptomyces sp. WAC 06783]|nr:hypothetical protein DMH18_20120 [Streptomyces sp. WAC 06783]
MPWGPGNGPGLARRPRRLVLCRPRPPFARSAASGANPGSASDSAPSQRIPVPRPHARLTVHGRRLLVERVRAGRPVAQVAEEMGISRTTAHKWVRRWRAEGDPGLHDRSSRPLTTPHRTPADVENRIREPRRDCKLGPARIGPGPGHTQLDGPPRPDPPRPEPAALDGPAHRSDHPPLRTIASRRTGPRRHQEARQDSRRRRTSDHAPPAGRRQSAGHHRCAQGRQSRHQLQLRPHSRRRSLPARVQRGSDRRTQRDRGLLLAAREYLLRRARHQRRARPHGQRLLLQIPPVRPDSQRRRHHR